jgi:pimeloyl-ACP methyl ester carboxylesterase
MSGVARFCGSQTGETACCRLIEGTGFDGQEVAWGRMGDGPALVLIHGTPFSSQVWRRIAPLLARRWTVYYFDLLGYGLSDMRDQQDVSLSVQNRLLVSLFAEWKIDRPDVLCHDFGGATALRGYFLNGLRYHSLTIFDAVALAPWGSPFVAHVRKHETAFAGLPPMPMRRCFVLICKVPPIVL